MRFSSSPVDSAMRWKVSARKAGAGSTSASLAGDLPPLPPGTLRPGGVAYDTAYAARPTPFVEWGAGQGAAVATDGLGMLVEQAAESFRLWRGREPRTGPVIEALRNHLAGGRPSRPRSTSQAAEHRGLTS